MKLLLLLIAAMTITLIALMANHGASADDGWVYWLSITSIDWNIAVISYNSIKLFKI